MNICVNNNCWFTNVGEAFIDLGLKAIIKNISKNNDIHYSSVSPMTKYYLPNIAKEHAIFNGNLYKPDLFLLAGMYATKETFMEKSIWETYETAKRIVANGGKVGFVGLGGMYYDKKERDEVLKGLDKLQPLFIITRDRKTYDLYKDYFECKKGLDCAFWLKDDYDPRGLKCIEYEVSTFNRSYEPDEIASIEGMIHPWHMQFFLDDKKTCYLAKKNLFVSDGPYEYLTLYANAKKVYTDLVHATIPCLVYETPVKYWTIDDRRGAFESIDYISKDEEGFLYINQKKLEEEKREIELYIETKIQSLL